jgi:Cu(I)/Ag(I) efflux system protein CusF
MTKTLQIAALVFLSIGLPSCGQKAETPTADASRAAVPVAGKSGKATGTVTAIDAAAGTITLDHGAIPAVGWPPMTMAFSAKPETLTGIAVGNKVDFDVTVTGSGGQITAIQKQ